MSDPKPPSRKKTASPRAPKSGEISSSEINVPGDVVHKSALGFDQIEFSFHARQRMRQRQVTEEFVINTIKKPDMTGLKTQMFRNRVRKWKGTKLAVDVVYTMTTDRIIVITVITQAISR
jgi:hypothetical protein